MGNRPIKATTRSVSPLRFIWDRRRPLDFLDRLASWPGDIARANVGRHAVVVLKHPDLIQQVLVADADKTEKGRTLERSLFFLFLGDGLLNSAGEKHRRQRRLLLPGFHRTRLSGYSKTITEAIENATATWRDGDIKDFTSILSGLTLSIVSRALFSSAVEEDATTLTTAFGELTANVNRLTFPGAAWLLQSPLPFARRVRRAEQVLNTAVYSLIARRRKNLVDTGDLLSTLLLTEDAEHPGQRLTDEEIRDHVMTLLFAGHETTANALLWILWLLVTHPHITERLTSELDRVVSGTSPQLGDIPALIMTEQVVRESLRLYPPIWAMGRRLRENVSFDGVVTPKDSLIVASQWITHRDARWFDDPASFKPERWTPEFRSTLPRFAYFPFGGGARSCIGENFAWMEFILVVASLFKNWTFQPAGAQANVGTKAQITLHPNQPIVLRVRRRK